MLRYFIKRLLFLIPVILVVSFLVFSLMSMSGDPARTLAGENMTEEQVEELRESMGLNDPLLVRYGRYMAGALHGDFGESLYGKNVWQEYIGRLPYTLVLAVAAMILTVLLSVPFGIIAALKRNSWLDAGVSAVAVIGLSIPGFWLGVMLILWVALGMGLVPTGGADEALRSLILPAITAAAPNAALVCRTTRSSMLDALSADYLRTARAKGVAEKRVVLKHALGNALIPIITIVGSQFSILVGGTVVVETVFSWPGVGNLIVTAVRGNDYNMVTGCVVMTTVFVALILLAVDMLYAFVDPRIKAQYSRR